ncbi:MAG: hypothetical protein L3J39_17595 [Verrucomicrobiales bacterium]|nr:hypothetical protein [Verrucomicrobiales bacterium]
MKSDQISTHPSRRHFLTRSFAAGASIAAPMILPSSVLGDKKRNLGKIMQVEKQIIGDVEAQKLLTEVPYVGDWKLG